MARKSKRDWLMEGVDAITEVGADKMTIDTLTTRLGVTKGSFYHHFSNLQDFIDQLLVFIEQESTLLIIDAAEKYSTPRQKLEHLLRVTVEQTPNLREVALRAWALQNAQVRELQARIDQQRREYVRGLYAEILGDDQAAAQLADTIYLLYVGAQQVIPPLDGAALESLYRMVWAGNDGA